MTPVRAAWVVYTERKNEGNRRGYGQEALEQTLKHLAGRGDTRCDLLPEHDEGSTPAITYVQLKEWR